MPIGTTWDEIIQAAIAAFGTYGFSPLVAAAGIVGSFGALLLALRRGLR